MKKALLFTALAVVLLLVAAAIYLSSIDADQFRPQIQAAVEKQLGRPVTLGRVGLRLIPLSVQIAGITIAEDPAFNTGAPFASAKQVSVGVAILPLLRGRLHIRSFVLRDPVIELARNKAGRWNFSTLGATGASSGGSTGKGESGLSITELRAENGTIAISSPGKTRSAYTHINIRLADFGAGKRFRLDVTADLPGAKSESLRLSAEGTPPGAGPIQLAGDLQIRQARLAELRSFLNAGAAPADGFVTADVKFDLKDPVANAQCKLTLEKMSVNGKQLGRDVRIEGGLSHNLDSGLLKIAELRLLAGGAPILISGEMSGSAIDARLRTEGAPLGELLAAAAALGAGGVSGSGRLTLDARVRGSLDRPAGLEYTGQASLRDAVLDIPALTKPVRVSSADLKLSGNAASIENLLCSLGTSTLRGALAVRNFSAPQADFTLQADRLDIAELQQLARPTAAPAAKKSAAPQADLIARGKLSVGAIVYNEIVLKQVEAGCNFERRVLTLSPLTAQVFGGKQTGGITVDMRSEPATVSMNTKLESVDANALLSATTSLKKAVYGLLAAGGDASMKLASGADAARSLNGNLSIRLNNGRIGGINLLNELASVGRFVGLGKGGQPFTDVAQLSGDVRIRNGVAASDNLLMRIEGGSVASAGTVNLADQSLDLRITAVLDRDASQRAGGSRIGGYLTTALVNDKGEIVIPAIVTGTFEKPRFAPDAARFAEMKLKNVMPTAGGLAGLGSGILGALTGKRPAQPEAGKKEEGAAATPAPAEAPKKKGLLGVLDTLRKAKEAEAAKKP